MDRRSMLRATVFGVGTMALPFTAWSAAYAAPAQNAPGPYGPLQPANAHGILLPAGFTSRIVARSSQAVPGTSYVWHNAPDGGAVFANGTGWIYVSKLRDERRLGGRRVEDPVQLQRHRYRRIAHPVRNQQQLCRGEDALEHLVVL
jgi:hypothetical protein